MAKVEPGENIIEIDYLNKVFRLPRERHNSVKGMFTSFFRRTNFDDLHALKDISFEVKKGEFFGIVGRNGSGKSTLLKLMAGIYVPTSGKINIKGSLTPFIELGVGFSPDLTGRENVYLNGALLGIGRREMDKIYDDIVEFAELERFMDQKLLNYSSGMQVRLAFSIAIRAHGDILLLDEVLAVGDAAFQRKCLDYFREIKESDKTVILVTHSMGTVEEFCDRALILEDSKVVDIGRPAKIALEYQAVNTTTSQKARNRAHKRPKNPDVRITKVTARSPKKETDLFGLDDDMIVDISLDVKKKRKIQLHVGLFNTEGRYVAGINSTEDLPDLNPKTGNYSVSCTFKAGQIAKGTYAVNVVAYTHGKEPEDMIDVFSSDYGDKSPLVAFTDTSLSKNGLFLIDASWEMK